MPWRFRKIFGFGPSRFTLTPSGVSSSLRLPGFRVGRNAEGRFYVSFGIPGTGLYYIRHF
ncbi:MAG TPA: DUF4236 domain-containing protein [Thermoanaerobaculia bacterium]